MQKTLIEQELFPLSKTRATKGNRRFVREKVMQVLVSYQVSKTDLKVLFKHIFFRDFHIDNEREEENIEVNNFLHQKILSPEEISEMLADTSIDWREEDIKFGQILTKESVLNKDFIHSILKQISENWDFDRVALIDKTIIVMGTTEMMVFPDIPLKVTINESIELAKKYSSDKSSIFVNGILEKMKHQLEKENKINKSERGRA
jgi:N utilization substance protein B